LKARLEILRRHECADAPAEDDFDRGAKALLTALAQRGVSVRQVGTSTSVVIKDGAVDVVVGADAARAASLLSR
jgi:GrpB-like predicted nucleotidyltransferase (UPF0157 family)